MLTAKVFASLVALCGAVYAIKFEYSTGFRPSFDQLAAYNNYYKLKSLDEGGGVDHRKEYYASKGNKEEDGHETKHHHDKGRHTKKSKEYDKGAHSENGGKRNNHHDEAKKYSQHEEARKSHKGAKFGEKKGHKRGHKTKGYHNQFFKDEYHKEHKFYDDLHKSGDYSKHGSAHAAYKNKEGAWKKGGNHKSGHQKENHGEKDYKVKGHVIDEHRGHDYSKGAETYHDRNSKKGTKGSSSGGKHYGYKKGH